MQRLFLFLCVFLSYASTFAGTQTGQVTTIRKRASDGLIYFYLSGVHSGAPSCAGSHDYWMIKDENSNTGKQQLAILLAARASGETITVDGSNTCTRWGDGEDVDLVSY